MARSYSSFVVAATSTTTVVAIINISMAITTTIYLRQLLIQNNPQNSIQNTKYNSIWGITMHTPLPRHMKSCFQWTLNVVGCGVRGWEGRGNCKKLGRGTAASRATLPSGGISLDTTHLFTPEKHILSITHTNTPPPFSFGHCSYSSCFYPITLLWRLTCLAACLSVQSLSSPSKGIQQGWGTFATPNVIGLHLTSPLTSDHAVQQDLKGHGFPITGIYVGVLSVPHSGELCSDELYDTISLVTTPYQLPIEQSLSP